MKFLVGKDVKLEGVVGKLIVKCVVEMLSSSKKFGLCKCNDWVESCLSYYDSYILTNLSMLKVFMY